MFGFLRAQPRDKLYRQIYAGCCSFQHREFGIESLPLLSYEAVFLYLLAADAVACRSAKGKGFGSWPVARSHSRNGRTTRWRHAPDAT
jgi:hypothetical protein